MMNYNNMLQFIIKNRWTIFLFLYHLFFAFVAYYILLRNPADAQNYWFVSENLSHIYWSDFLKPGTDFVKLFTFPYVKYFKLPFWSGFLIFNILSFLGIWLLYTIMNSIADNQKSLKLIIVLLLLLPNFHFWTSNIGKESLLLFPLIFVIYEIHRKKYYSFLLICSILFISAIRPHLAFILMISYFISLFFTQKLSARSKIMIFSCLIIGTVAFTVILIQLQDFSGGFQRVIKKYDIHIQYFKHTNAYVSMDLYPLPLKMFTFYFRPLLFEKHGLLYQIISLENTIVLLVSCIMVFYSVKYFGKLKKCMLFIFPIIIIFLFGLMYVYAYANYGIILRTKMIVTPFFYVAVMKVMSTALSNKKLNYKKNVL